MNETEQIVTNTNDFTLDDIYFKDAFTKTEDKLNLEVDNANISCLTSKSNKFSLDEDGNLVVNSITTLLGSNNQSVADLVYPVGSIYLSVNSNNPGTLFGGVWEQLKDKFLLGAGDIYAANTMGGEAEHILKVEEMPSHNHSIRAGDGGNGEVVGVYDTPGSGYTSYYLKYGLTSAVSPVLNNTYSGGNQAHNNMPPYMTIYIPKRVS